MLASGNLGATLRVFVSSRWEEMLEERGVAEQALAVIAAAKFIGMEHFGAAPKPKTERSLDEVGRCQVFVLLLGCTHSNIVEMEFERAHELGLPCLAYARQSQDFTAEQRAFIERVRSTVTPRHYSSLVELGIAITHDIMSMASDPAAWELSRALVPVRDVLKRTLDQFVGRSGLTEKVDAFLASEPSGYISVEGAAGLGKTTFCAHLAATRGYYHHFVKLAPGDGGVGVALANLAAQLLLDPRHRGFGARVAFRDGTLAPNQFRHLLMLTADRRKAKDPPLVFVVDGLDEAGKGGHSNPLALPDELPAGVYFIVSHRPGPTLFTRGAKLLIPLVQESRENLADIEAHIRAVLARPALRAAFDKARPGSGLDRDRFAQALIEKSRGLWIYVDCVLSEIQSQPHKAADVLRLPAGLWGYYADFWDRWRRAHRGVWHTEHLPVLATLMAARRPLPLDVIAQLAGVGDEAKAGLDEIINVEWRAMVAKEEDRGVPFYEAYHASLRDFFHGAQRGELEASMAHFSTELEHATRSAHRAFARQNVMALQNTPVRASGWTRESDYGSRFLVTHLVLGGAHDELHGLLDRSVPAGEGAEQSWWFQVQRERGRLTQFVADQEYALRTLWIYGRLSPAKHLLVQMMGIPEDVMRRASRYALGSASVRGLASAVALPFVGLLMQTGVWDEERALNQVRTIGDPAQRAVALAYVAREIEDQKRGELITEVFELLDTGPLFDAQLAHAKVLHILGVDAIERAGQRLEWWLRGWDRFTPQAQLRLMDGYAPFMKPRQRKQTLRRLISQVMASDIFVGGFDLRHVRDLPAPLRGALVQHMLSQRLLRENAASFVRKLLPHLDQREQKRFISDWPDAACALEWRAYWLRDEPVRVCWETIVGHLHELQVDGSSPGDSSPEMQAVTHTLLALAERLPRTEALRRVELLTVGLPSSVRETVNDAVARRVHEPATPHHSFERLQWAEAGSRLNLPWQLLIGHETIDPVALRRALSSAQLQSTWRVGTADDAVLLIERLAGVERDLVEAVSACYERIGDEERLDNAELIYGVVDDEEPMEEVAEDEAVPKEWELAYVHAFATYGKPEFELDADLLEGMLPDERCLALALMAFKDEERAGGYWDQILEYIGLDRDIDYSPAEALNYCAWSLPDSHAGPLLELLFRFPTAHCLEGLCSVASFLPEAEAKRALRYLLARRSEPLAKAALGMLLESLAEPDARKVLDRLVALVDRDVPLWVDAVLAVSLMPWVAENDRARLWTATDRFLVGAPAHMACAYAHAARHATSEQQREERWRSAFRWAQNHDPACLVSLLMTEESPLAAVRALLLEMAQTERSSALRMLIEYRAFIGRACGPSGVAGVRGAIQDVRRWWR